MGKPIDKHDPTQRGQEYLERGGIRIKPDREGYATAIGQTLLQFQIVENSVKEYLIFFEMKSRDPASFLAHRSRIENRLSRMSFGILSPMYTKRTSDKTLAARVAALIEPRNDAAHRAFQFYIGRSVTEDEYFAENMRLLDLNREIVACTEGVLSQVAALMLPIVRHVATSPALATLQALHDRELHAFLFAQLVVQPRG